MREDQMELDGLIQKVMDQMDKRRYGKKIITRYRSSFRLLISVSHDMREDRLSERLMKAFLDKPVSCGEKWAKRNWLTGNVASGCSCRLCGQELLTGEDRTLAAYPK